MSLPVSLQQSVLFSSQLCFVFFPLCGIVMTAEHKPAGFCLTETSQAELAGLVVNNKSPLSPPASDCRDVSSSCRVYFIPRASHRISLKLINENESSVDSAVVYWWQIGPHQNEYEFRPPREAAPCPAGCKPI